MALLCGIVGMPEVGKTTLFTALTKLEADTGKQGMLKSANHGIVPLVDSRLDLLAKKFLPERVVPATMEFVDVAGLASSASKKGGSGQILAHLRDCTLIVHVLRCFDLEDGTKPNPESDADVLYTELALADLESIQKRSEKLEKDLKDPLRKKEAQSELDAYAKLIPVLEQGKPARTADLNAQDRLALQKSFLVTMKDELFVCNVDLGGEEGECIEACRRLAQAAHTEAVIICGKFEAELAQLETELERSQFMEQFGYTHNGLAMLTASAYKKLGLRTFFTAGEDECRAWTIHAGDLAPAAAGVIHTDFEKGFIKAEIYHFSDLEALGTEKAIRDAGKLRQEGRVYEVQDGDVIFFKFNK